MKRNFFKRQPRMAACTLLAISCWQAAPLMAQDADFPVEPVQKAEAPEGAVGGMGDINLFPKRVVIDGRRSIATVGLYNKTINEGDYEIELQDLMMTPDGRIVPLDSVTDEAARARVRTASPFVRYSPRRVTLRGGESQTIRLMARADAEVPPGEYRSHFLAVSVPRESEGGLSIDDAVNGGGATGISVTIRPRFGISIPVIVRIGDTTLDVGLDNPQIVTQADGSKAIGVTIRRSGSRSAFGDMVVSARGMAQPVAVTRGIGVYPEVDERKVLLPIDPAFDPRNLVSGTQLTITYTDDDFAPGTRLAEIVFTVP